MRTSRPSDSPTNLGSGRDCGPLAAPTGLSRILHRRQGWPLLLLLFGALGLVGFAACAVPQPPKVAEALKAPAGQATAAASKPDPLARTRQLRADLEAVSDELLKLQPRVSQWNAALPLHKKRLKELEARRSEVQLTIEQEARAADDARNEYQAALEAWQAQQEALNALREKAAEAGAAPPEPEPEPEPPSEPVMPPPTDPEIVASLDLNLDLLRQHIEQLSYLLELIASTQEEGLKGIAAAEKLLREASQPDLKPPIRVTLDDALRLMAEIQTLNVSLSLSKSRRAGLIEEQEALSRRKYADKRSELPTLGPLPADPAEKIRQNREEILRLREQYTERLGDLNEVGSRTVDLSKKSVQVKLDCVRLKVEMQTFGVNALEQKVQRYLLTISVSKSDLAEAEKAYAKDLAELESQDKELRKDLRVKRYGLVATDQAWQGFSAERRDAATLSLIQHQLYLIEMRKQYLKFRFDALHELYRLTRSQGPSEKFLKDYEFYLDEEKQKKARDEIAQRRSAWQNEYARVSKEARDEADKELTRAVIGQYREILDIYDRLDDIQWERDWVRTIANDHIARWQAAQRGFLWYAGRIAASIAIFLACLWLSIRLGRLTLRKAREKVAKQTAKRQRAQPAQAAAGDQEGSRPAEGWRYVYFGIYLTSLAVLWFALAFLAIGSLWGLSLRLETIYEILNVSLFMMGEKEVSTLSLLKLILGLSVTIVVIKGVERYLQRQIFEYFAWDLGIRHAVLVIVRYLLLFAGLALSLEFIGVGLGALALFAGVIGIGIGFGLQNIASNFISGLIILFERPVKKGDFIDAGGLEGTVLEIRARATTIKTRDNVSVIVPNSDFVTQKVVNWSHGSRKSRYSIPVGVAYGSDVTLVKRLLEEIGAAEPWVLKDPPPKVWLNEFGSSSLNFSLVIWSLEVEQRRDLISAINYRIEQRFREHGIVIPYPQQDVHVKELPPPSHA